MEHVSLLREAIKVAVESVENGGGPFGAVIAKDGRVIAKAGNRVTLDGDPTAHAEVLAIRQAAEVLGRYELSDCVIYTSCEPCPMCLGAIYWARIPEVYYGAHREDAKRVGFDDEFIYDELAKAPGARRVKMSTMLRKDAVVCFEAWKDSPKKKAY